MPSGLRMSLADQLVTDLVTRIVDGEFAAGDPLPPEAELAEAADVGRSTVREAVRGLIGLGMVQIRRGRGTYVLPEDRWSPFDPVVLDARSRSPEDSRRTGRALLEARRLVEAGVAELAAQRADARQIEAMADAVRRAAEADDDIDAFVAADLAFHEALMDAAGNPYVAALFDPLDRLLRVERVRTSALASGRARAVRAHGRILDAVRVGDVDAARAAMTRHLDETAQDVETGSATRSEPTRTP